MVNDRPARPRGAAIRSSTAASWLMSCLAIAGASAVADAQPAAMLEVPAADLERLGVEWIRPEPAGGRAVLSVPAETAVPPNRETVVSTQVGGLVMRVFVAEGSEVEAGDPLVELRSLELLDAQREYVDAAAAARLATAQLERDRTMHEEGIIAKRRLDESEAAALAARTRAEQTRQRLRLIGADDAVLSRLASSGEISAELTLRSPIGGIVVMRHGAVGEQVEALEPIVRLADLSELWLEARVPQERADEVAPGMQLAVDAQGGTLTGEIFQVGRVVDAGTQTVLVRASVDNTRFALRAGQVILARVLTADAGGGTSLAVPMSAVARIDGQAFVFTRRPTGFAAVPVTLVGETAGRAQIEAEGLDARDEIAGRGVSAIKALLTADDE